MSKTILHRPARMQPPPVPSQEVTVISPPAQQPTMGMSWWPQLMFPLVSIMGSAYFIVYNPQPTYIAISLTMVLASISLSFGMVLQQASAGRRRVKLERERYIEYLRRLGMELRETARLQEDAARFTHADDPELWAIACGRVRVWERRPEHPDFGVVRIGRGPVPLATPLRLANSANPLTQNSGAAAAFLMGGAIPGQSEEREEQHTRWIIL